MKQKLSVTIENSTDKDLEIFMTRHRFRSKSDCVDKIIRTVLYNNQQKARLLQNEIKTKGREIRLLNEEMIAVLEEVKKQRELEQCITN